MDQFTLYKHVTDGGAIYITTEEDDIYSTILRLDGNEIEIVNEKRLFKFFEVTK